jgi:Arc/MetJ family transcription regulator
MKDVAVEEYVEAIETHLRARRGTDHILSPADFGLARSWHQAGVPLATVLVGIDRAFERNQNVTSLSYCRRRVEELAASGPGPRLRPSPPAESVPLSEVEALLASLSDQLRLVHPGKNASFEPPLRKIQEIQDLLAVASRPNWEYVKQKLREIDDDVSAAVVQALPEEQLTEFRAEAARAIERHRGKVDDAALQDAMARYLLQRAREKLGLPRVSFV